MARIKKLKENGATIYPATILDAVVDPSTNRKLSNTAIRYFTGGISRYYKFMSFDVGGDKGMIRFGIISPILGYGEFLISWGWQGTTEKHCYPYCVLSTGSQMYNRVKLVRTGDSTFDAYFESNSGNDYATFVFMGQSGTSVKSFSVSGVSSIPTVYRESVFVSKIYFSSIGGTLAGTADNANKLGNYGLFTSSSGSPAGNVPLIGTDGVMEAGCYIDFHANGDTSDYNLRLMYDEDTKQKRWVKFPKASGYLAIGDETGTAMYANSAMTADRLRTASNIAGDEDMPDTDSVQSFAGYVGNNKTNKYPILSVTTEFLNGAQQLSLQIGFSTEHGLMCRTGLRNSVNGEFLFSVWKKILTQDI